MTSGEEEPAFEEQSATEEAFKIDFNITGEVPIIKQNRPKLCWAAAAAMMVSWRENRRVDMGEVVDRAGVLYRERFNGNCVLSKQEADDFIFSLGLQTESPKNFTVNGMLDLLRSYKPLWIVTSAWGIECASLHSIVAVGMYGDGSIDHTFIRYIDPGFGEGFDDSFGSFGEKYEIVFTSDKKCEPQSLGRPQIIHY